MLNFLGLLCLVSTNGAKPLAENEGHSFYPIASDWLASETCGACAEW